MESHASRFVGVVVAIIADLWSVVVAVYLIWTFALGNTIDYEWVTRGQKVPPESYPLLLLAIWVVLQHAKSRLRPKEGVLGLFFYYEDLGVAVFMALFISGVGIYAVMNGFNLTFALTILAFLIVGVADMLFGGTRGRNPRSEYAGVTPVGGAVADDDQHQHMAQMPTEIIPYYRDGDGILRRWRMFRLPVYHDPQPPVIDHQPTEDNRETGGH
jgi:hypothetical protein